MKEAGGRDGENVKPGRRKTERERESLFSI